MPELKVDSSTNPTTDLDGRTTADNPIMETGLGGVGPKSITPISAPGVAGDPLEAPYSEGQFDHMYGQRPPPSRLTDCTPDLEDFVPDDDSTSCPETQSQSAVTHTELLLKLSKLLANPVALAKLDFKTVPSDAALARLSVRDLRILINVASR
ncbi:TPA: hypothetical protein DEP96_00360 [Candidatus Uhrbacteria bacterium]|nr:hypothetical protein [Candidatus Uhrbacteria bacterium]